MAAERLTASNQPTVRRKVATIGIIGGGQLAKMTAQAALQLGCEVVILESQPEFPAAPLAARHVNGDWNDPEALLNLAAQVDVVTLENEFVDADALAQIENAGHEVWPSSNTMRLVQDKFIQKQTLNDAGLPTARAAAVRSIAEIRSIAESWGFPLLLKARHNAYDGKGNATLQSAADIETAWKQLGGPNGRHLYVEEFCTFTSELAVIVTRSANGEMAAYPVVETVQRNHVCHSVTAPAQISPDVAAEATLLACKAALAVNAVGSFGIEMFLTSDGRILINEMAPRVHNSGHYTIEACDCSQFENHVRAILGLPLGSTEMRAPAAVMINLLGDQTASGTPFGLAQALSESGAHIHIYGKARAAKGRKMGHVTALGNSIATATLRAERAANCITFDQ